MEGASSGGKRIVEDASSGRTTVENASSGGTTVELSWWNDSGRSQQLGVLTRYRAQKLRTILSTSRYGSRFSLHRLFLFQCHCVCFLRVR